MPGVSTGRLAAASVVLLAAMCAAAVARTPGRPVARGAGAVVTVRFDVLRPGPVVAPRFLGLSFEAESVPQLGAFAGAGDAAALLRDVGPGVLRVGGVTADAQGFTGPGVAPDPGTSTTISAADLARLAALVRVAGWRVLLTVDLAHDDPPDAAAEAAAAHRALGSSLLAISVGNEPDAYGRHGLRPLPWGFAQYRPQLEAYRRAIAAAAPGVPLAGPDTTGAAFAAWGPGEARDIRPALLTTHRYPLVCEAVPAPSIAALLDDGTRARDMAQLASDMAIARAARLPLRIDEANSVSCGGVAGVSDTFASALWAVEFIAEAMDAGVAGVNFHDIPSNCLGYSPLCAPSAAALARGALVARPEFYALLMMRALVSDRALPTALTPGSDGVRGWAFLSPHGKVAIALVDVAPPGAPAATVRIDVGRRFTHAHVTSLTAPSPAATGDVRLGGRAVAADGAWPGAGAPLVVRAAADVVTVSLAPSSGALVGLG